jgi:hypothetical protein
VDVVAKEAILRNSSGQNYTAQNVSVTIDMGATAGNANALDTGAEAADKWYYIWLIYNGTTVAGLFSVSATTPSLPSGYTYKALVGVVLNGTGSDFFNFVQHGKQVWEEEAQVFTAKNATASNTWEILAGADLTAFRRFVPPIAAACRGMLGDTSTSNSSQFAICACNSDGSVNTAVALGACRAVVPAIGAAFDSFASCAFFEVPVRGGSTYDHSRLINIQWKARVNSGLSARLTICGFTLP